MLATKGWIVPGLLLTSIGSAAAQAPFPSRSASLEARAEFAFPTGTFRESLDLDTGLGLGITAKYWFGRPVAIYAGWDRFQFNGGSGDTDTEATDTGFRLGAQAHLPRLPRISLAPFVTGGVFANRVTLERTVASAAEQKERARSTGVEVGGGVLVPLGRGVWLVPEGRYRFHTPAFQSAAFRDVDEITYSSINLGVTVRVAQGRTTR